MVQFCPVRLELGLLGALIFHLSLLVCTYLSKSPEELKEGNFKLLSPIDFKQ